MKMSSWTRKMKNDCEVSSSRGTCQSGRAPSLPTPAALLRLLPPAPLPEDYVGRGPTIDESPPRQRDRRYVRLEECEALWALPVGPRLDAEICHRIRNLPQSLREDRQYRNMRFWYDFLNWEHTARRRTTRHQDF
jgi:hypothetical protein